MKIKKKINEYMNYYFSKRSFVYSGDKEEDWEKKQKVLPVFKKFKEDFKISQYADISGPSSYLLFSNAANKFARKMLREGKSIYNIISEVAPPFFDNGEIFYSKDRKVFLVYHIYRDGQGDTFCDTIDGLSFDEVMKKIQKWSGPKGMTAQFFGDSWFYPGTTIAIVINITDRLKFTKYEEGLRERILG